MIRPRHWLSALVIAGLALLAFLALEARADTCAPDTSEAWQMTAEGLTQDLGRAATPAEVCAYITSHRST